MATISYPAPLSDALAGTPRAHALDRWIFVIMAVWFIALALTGFIPDSLMKIEMVRMGVRPPFPSVLHMHAVLMGAYLLFLLSQTVLVATGRSELHRRVGPIGGLLAIALVIVGFVLAPTMYHQVRDALSTAPPEAQGAVRQLVSELENILFLQIQAGALFTLFIVLGLSYRSRDPGFHKRMMVFAPAMVMGAAFARMPWLPHTIPDSPVSILSYQWLALAPFFLWDVIRNRRLHRAYLVLLAAYLPFNLFAITAWDTPWWHTVAQRVMGV